VDTKDDLEQRTTGGVERRQHVRVKLTARIVGRPLGAEHSFVIQEASVGGFSFRCQTPFVPDVEYRFRLANESGQSTIVETVCRHCLLVNDDLPKQYVAGFQFLPQATMRLRMILGAIATDAP
jgi:hypothetical protein